jgi:CheY-like chemotaxis protein
MRGSIEIGRPAPRLLVAEDDTEMRVLVASSLRRDGYDVVEVSTGDQLIEALAALPLRSTTPDLIVSDVRMPGRSGLEILAALRRTGRVTPVILITAFPDAATHAEARRLDAVVFDKPFDLDDLRTAVLNMVSQRVSPPVETDIEGLRLVVVDDDAEMRSWLRVILERRGASVEEAASGWEMLHLLAERSFDLVITDVRMPMPNGIGVLAMARAAGVTTPFLVITAFPAPGLTAMVERSVDTVLLAKPFDEETLLDRVHELVRSAAEPEAT